MRVHIGITTDVGKIEAPKHPPLKLQEILEYTHDMYAGDGYMWEVDMIVASMERKEEVP